MEEHYNTFCRTAMHCILTINIIQNLSFSQDCLPLKGYYCCKPKDDAALLQQPVKSRVIKLSTSQYVYFQAKPIGSTTTEDIADIGSNRVSLDLPSQLIGSSFTLATRISEIIGDLILVSQSYKTFILA